MKTINVEIRGVTPLLIHRFGEDAEQAGSARSAIIQRDDPRAEAAKHAYIAPDGTYYFSAFAITGSMGNAGASHKQRGTRKSLKYVVPCAVRVTSDIITILDDKGAPKPFDEADARPTGFEPIRWRPARHFEVDGRPVTIPATKGRIMRYRPRWNTWGAAFTLLVEETVLPVEVAHQLLIEAGSRIGIGDFRPEKTGPFGTFRVTKFEEHVEA